MTLQKLIVLLVLGAGVIGALVYAIAPRDGAGGITDVEWNRTDPPPQTSNVKVVHLWKPDPRKDPVTAYEQLAIGMTDEQVTILLGRRNKWPGEWLVPAAKYRNTLRENRFAPPPRDYDWKGTTSWIWGPYQATPGFTVQPGSEPDLVYGVPPTPPLKQKNTVGQYIIEVHFRDRKLVHAARIL